MYIYGDKDKNYKYQFVTCPQITGLKASDDILVKTLIKSFKN